MRKLIENLIFVLFGFICSVIFYVKATTNAIDDNYYPGVSAFKEPFYFGALCLLIVLLLAAIYSIFSHFKSMPGNSLIFKFSITVLVSIIVVICLGQMPCFYLHEHPHTLTTLLKQSFICPSYSNRSYTGFIIYIIPAFAALLLSRPKNDKST